MRAPNQRRQVVLKLDLVSSEQQEDLRTYATLAATIRARVEGAGHKSQPST